MPSKKQKRRMNKAAGKAPNWARTAGISKQGSRQDHQAFRDRKSGFGKNRSSEVRHIDPATYQPKESV